MGALIYEYFYIIFLEAASDNANDLTVSRARHGTSSTDPLRAGNSSRCKIAVTVKIDEHVSEIVAKRAFLCSFLHV